MAFSGRWAEAVGYLNLGAAVFRAQKIRMGLGGSANMLEPFPERPKGMHLDTYMRLYWEHHEVEMQHLAGMQERLDNVREGLDELEKRVG